MIGHAAVKARPIELSDDPAFSLRVKRLGTVSLVAPGLIWWLATTRLDVPSEWRAALFVGWWLMPAVLWASVRLPSLRPLVFVPATLITAPVLGIVLWWLPGQLLGSLGWISISAGLLMGGVLGGWFWFRWAPVPMALDAPFAPMRWRLIAIHVALIAIGLVLASVG